MSYRPGGVLALAILFIIIGALYILGAIMYESYVTMSSNSMALSALQLYEAGPSAFGGLLIPLGYEQATISSSFSLSYILIGFAVIFAALFIPTAVGLLRMKNWGRILALVFGILNMAGGAISLLVIVGITLLTGGAIGLLVIVGIIPLVFGIIVVAYLMGDVKHEFE